MKKLVLILGLVSTGFAVHAQTKQELPFKPTQGDVTTEFGLTGGLNSTNYSLNDGAGLLRFRYFAKERLAYRVGLRVATDNETQKVYGPNGEEGFRKEKENQVQLNLGIEKHFAGTDHLSPYIGADLLFGIEKPKTETENFNPAGGGSYQPNVSSEIKGPGIFSLGLRGVIGADYYIAKHLYLGAEAGLGIAYEMAGKTKATFRNGTTTTNTTIDSPGNTFEVAPTIITGVRIGFVF